MNQNSVVPRKKEKHHEHGRHRTFQSKVERVDYPHKVVVAKKQSEQENYSSRKGQSSPGDPPNAAELPQNQMAQFAHGDPSHDRDDGLCDPPDSKRLPRFIAPNGINHVNNGGLEKAN